MMRLRTRLEIRVEYASPARDCRRVLRVLPLLRGGQNVEREKWKVEPDADLLLEKRDGEGNRRLLIHHRRVQSGLRFGLEIEVQTSGTPILELAPDRAKWKMPSRAVDFTPEVQKLAREARELSPLERAAHFAAFCERNLEYNAQTDAHPRVSGAVWEGRSGNCADFTHLFLSLCRASGLPARYVGGYSRGQGQMHAWAEVWDANYWHPFDPTMDAVRAARPLNHIAVALGRDFYDCAPHGGQFRGGGTARLELWCHTQRLDAA